MRIETARLLITDLREDMAEDLWRNSLDEDNRRFVPDEVFETLGDAQQVLSSLMAAAQTGDGPFVYPVLTRQGDNVGYVQLCMAERGWEVGYHIAKPCTGRGYATEALRAVLRFGFNTLRLNRIEAQHELDNPASGRVMEKCGMRCEGTLRQRVFNKGRFSDVRLYAILRGDGVPGNEHI